MDNVGISNAIIGFAQFARRKGLNVGIEDTFNALKAFDMGLHEDKLSFYFALKTLFCTSKDDIPVFDDIFFAYWNIEPDNGQQETKKKVKSEKNIQKEETILTIWGKGNKDNSDGKDSKTTTGANIVEKVRKTDFAKLAEMEVDILNEIAEKLWREMLKRMKRRLKTASAKDTVDIRKTIRASLQHGGDPIALKHKGQKPKKLRLVVMLDVSGSMDKYSFFLLRFVYALQQYFERVESFIFSTHLKYITEYIYKNGLEKTLKLLSDNADNWSSGTKIGACLREFNAQYGKQMLSRSSLVIILSDGLDTGEKGIIENEIQQIRRRTKRLIWLNPLKGMENYSPEARGMKEALPYIDTFRSAHSLNSLLELEDFLMNVS
jgi:uncharacterized protein